MMSKKKGGWRYQPVIVKEADGEDIIFLVEIHLTGDDKLRMWGESKPAYPLGETVEEISRDIVHMYVSSVRWKPVRYDELCVGMTFEANFDQRMAFELASMFEGMKH